MRWQLGERRQGRGDAPHPALLEILTGVRALMKQGCALADIAVVMRSTADLSAPIGCTHGVPQ